MAGGGRYGGVAGGGRYGGEGFHEQSLGLCLDQWRIHDLGTGQ